MGQLSWYVARSAGLVAWVLLTASVCWGLAMTTRVASRWTRRPWLLDLHRYLGGLAVIFTGVHVAAIVADSFVHFDLASVLVPFASSWRPFAVAWGVVAVYLLLAVELTSLARARLPRKVWRATHFASFPLFFVATVHGVLAGTDAHGPIATAVVVAAVAGVTGLTALRVAHDARLASWNASSSSPSPSSRAAATNRSTTGGQPSRPRSSSTIGSRPTPSPAWASSPTSTSSSSSTSSPTTTSPWAPATPAAAPTGPRSASSPSAARPDRTASA
jgi:hypothetical protein